MPDSLLVVDDDSAVRRGLQTLLEQAGYHVSCAENGQQAIELLTSSSLPALVVLDILIPEIDGLEVCRFIRSLPTHLPVLMLSSLDEVSDKVTGLEVGADDYLTKPFDPRELIARVRSLLRFKHGNGAPTASTTLRHGPITMWLDQHRVEVQGQVLPLSPKEWTLLELLLRHPNQVFGREMLLRHVWGYDYDGDSRTVDVHIQRLRSRLSPHGLDTLIETVRGFGYRLIPAPTDPPAEQC